MENKKGRCPMQIAGCEDDPHEQEQLLQAIRCAKPEQDADCFLNGAAFLERAGESPHFDIAFIDIYLPGENGIVIAGALQEQSPDTKIVFVTTSREHAIDAFSINALHYLVKPITVQGIAEVFRRLTELRVKKRETISFVPDRNSHTIFMDQICCLESFRHAVEITLADGRKLKVWITLKELECKLNRNFLKINRGIIVNMDYIAQMGTDVCILQDGSRLPVRTRNSAEIRAAYDNFIFAQLSQHQTR